MAWNTVTTWVAGDTPVLATVINDIGLDIRTWGASVDAGGYNLTNCAKIHGASNVLKIYTASTERVRVSATGLVGIGIAADTKLHVAADITDSGGAADGQFTISSATTSNKRMRFGYDSTNDRGYIQAVNVGTLVSPLVLNPAGGSVGIQVATTTAPLAVANLETYADNTAAVAGGLVAGDFYRTSTGVLMVTY